MSARAWRGFLTVNNIVEVCDESPELVFEEIQSLIDAAQYDIPDEGVSIENIEICMQRQAYYSNQYPYLIGLWGVVRSAAGTDKHRIAMRDYLEKAASACKVKYEGASRVLTDIQAIQQESRGTRTW